MSVSLHHRTVNGPYEDPCLYVRPTWHKYALLFDAGSAGRLSNAEILKIQCVFVTHTHIDHFIGFDGLLRVLLKKPAPVLIVGPAGITDNIQGKLSAYTWNLIEDYPLRLDVAEVRDGQVHRSRFEASKVFKRESLGSDVFDGVVFADDQFIVRAAELEHGIPTLGFSIEEEVRINIDKAALDAMGLPLGPWLAELKAAIRAKQPDNSEIIVEGKPFPLGQLRTLARLSPGQKITYVADTSPTHENIQTITALARGSSTLYLEAYFMAEDHERAVERRHLTTVISGTIAREAGVAQYVPFHFSPKYISSPVSPYDEAIEEFRRAAS